MVIGQAGWGRDAMARGRDCESVGQTGRKVSDYNRPSRVGVSPHLRLHLDFITSEWDNGTLAKYSKLMIY